MQAALKQYTSEDFALPGESSRLTAGQRGKMVIMFLMAVLMMTAVLVAQIWIKIDIDETYQGINQAKVKNAQLRDDIRKLDARLSEVQSYDVVDTFLKANGIVMGPPESVVYVAPSDVKTKVAITQWGAPKQ